MTNDSDPEVLLAGGNMDSVVRVGDTVRRVAGDWTAGVHGLLQAYERAGIDEVPRAQGLDTHGREVLSFIPGDVMVSLPPQEQWKPSLLVESAALMRRLHDASESLLPSSAQWRQESHDPAEVVCHNDFAPYNLIVRDGHIAGVIDFDMSSPGSRIWDLAYLAYRVVPFAEDAHGFVPQRDGSRTRRLSDLIGAYGCTFDADEVTRVAAVRLDALAAFTEQRAKSTGRSDLSDHAAMYRRDARRLRTGSSPTAES